jgi:hypothetical protein
LSASTLFDSPVPPSLVSSSSTSSSTSSSSFASPSSSASSSASLSLSTKSSPPHYDNDVIMADVDDSDGNRNVVAKKINCRALSAFPSESSSSVTRSSSSRLSYITKSSATTISAVSSRLTRSSNKRVLDTTSSFQQRKLPLRKMRKMNCYVAEELIAPDSSSQNSVVTLHSSDEGEETEDEEPEDEETNDPVELKRMVTILRAKVKELESQLIQFSATAKPTKNVLQLSPSPIANSALTFSSARAEKSVSVTRSKACSNSTVRFSKPIAEFRSSPASPSSPSSPSSSSSASSAFSASSSSPPQLLYSFFPASSSLSQSTIASAYRLSASVCASDGSIQTLVPGQGWSSDNTFELEEPAILRDDSLTKPILFTIAQCPAYVPAVWQNDQVMNEKRGDITLAQMNFLSQYAFQLSLSV